MLFPAPSIHPLMLPARFTFECVLSVGARGSGSAVFVVVVGRRDERERGGGREIEGIIVRSSLE